MRLVGHVISHTHWDRAWYQPFEVFRLRLSRLMKKLLALMESDRACRFTFDGQTLPLDDHIEVHPEDRPRIERLVKSGRLEAGPFYVLPDEFLVTGESLIRNLALGIAEAEGFGRVLREGALSDLFGHPSQVPQVLNGFGIRSAFVARGLTREQLARGWAQRWRAPDGRSEVILYSAPGGYANLYAWGIDSLDADAYPTLPTDADEWSEDVALRQLERLVDEYRDGRMTTRHLYLGNGVDHQEPQPHAGELIRRLNRRQGRVRLAHGGFAGFFDAIRRERRRLPRLDGPLGDCDLVDTITSRVTLKQDYAEIAGRLEMLTEPLVACAEMFARGRRAWREPHHLGFTLNAGPNWVQFFEPPAREIEHLWKLLLRNAPHDDLCGCSVDATHRDMENRFKRAREINEHLLHDALLLVASRVAEPLGASTLPTLVVFNPHPFAAADVLRADVFLRNVSSARGLRLVDERRRDVPFAVERAERVERPDWDGNNWRKEPVRGLALRVALGPSLPPGSFSRFTFDVARAVAPAARGRAPSVKIRGGSAVVEDALRRLVVRRDGTFDLFDKRLGRRFANLGLLEDIEDAGDSYRTRRFARPARPVTSRGAPGRVRLLAHHALATQVEAAFTLRLPARATRGHTRRDAKTVGVPVRVRLDVAHHDPVLRLTVRVENRARDHKLSMLFPTGLAADAFGYDTKFDWRRYAAGEAQGRIDSTALAADGRAALGVVSDCPTLAESRREARGLRLGLPLFRAVDKVSPAVPRDVWVGEEAECLRVIERRLALVTGRPADVREACLRARRTLIAPPALVAVTPSGKHRYRDRTFTTLDVPAGPLVECRGNDLHLSAWKKSEDGRAWIVRVYSLAGRKQTARLAAAVPVRGVRLCRLDERPVCRLHRGRDIWRFPIAPREIVTLRLDLDDVALGKSLRRKIPDQCARHTY